MKIFTTYIFFAFPDNSYKRKSFKNSESVRKSFKNANGHKKGRWSSMSKAFILKRLASQSYEGHVGLREAKATYNSDGLWRLQRDF